MSTLHNPNLPNESLNSIIYWKYMNSLSVFHIGTWLDPHHVRKPNSQIIPDDSIHAYFFIWAVLVSQNYTNSFFPPFALE